VIASHHRDLMFFILPPYVLVCDVGDGTNDFRLIVVTDPSKGLARGIRTAESKTPTTRARSRLDPLNRAARIK
jgi:hypothetical protein